MQVVTGFLGSGKTTLLNHVLSQDHGRRIAVIENEVRAVSGLASRPRPDMGVGAVSCTVSCTGARGVSQEGTPRVCLRAEPLLMCWLAGFLQLLGSCWLPAVHCSTVLR